MRLASQDKDADSVTRLHGSFEPHRRAGCSRLRPRIGRALSSQPKLLLMDEPLSALDRAKLEGVRYVVCRNEKEAENDRKDREAIVAALDAQLKKGDKALVGNSAYRRYLRKVGAKGGRSFEIDAGKLAEEARFDGIFVLRTNAKVTPLQAVLRYRDLLQVEDLFRRTKAIMRTRPIGARSPSLGLPQRPQRPRCNLQKQENENSPHRDTGCFLCGGRRTRTEDP